MEPLVINAICFKESGMWIAQCLEYNFVSCAETQEELPHALMEQILGQIEDDTENGHEPFFGFKPAPAKYWELFEKAKLQSKPIREQVSVPEKVETHLFPVAA